MFKYWGSHKAESQEGMFTLYSSWEFGDSAHIGMIPIIFKKKKNSKLICNSFDPDICENGMKHRKMTETQHRDTNNTHFY